MSVVVVGAGVGGLAVAARLAAAGHQVTVCERSDVVGGKLGQLTAGGYRFDTGPSLLTMPYVFADLFEATGAPIDTVLTLRPLDPIARYRYPDGTTFDSCADPAAFRERLGAALGPSAAAQWTEFFERARRIWDATHEPFLESPLDGPATLARLASRVRDLRTVAPWRTLRGLANTSLDDPRLRMFVERYATYTGSDPRRAPAALAAVPYAELAFGGWYVEGGLYGLAEALRDRCVALGVTIRTGTEVVSVLTGNQGVTGVSLADGERLAASIVVSDVDAAHLYGSLLSGSPPRGTPSLSGFVLMLGLRGTTPDLAHHTVLFPDDYDAEFDAVFGPHARPVDDPTLYISAPPPSGAAATGHPAASSKPGSAASPGSATSGAAGGPAASPGSATSGAAGGPGPASGAAAPGEAAASGEAAAGGRAAAGEAAAGRVPDGAAAGGGVAASGSMASGEAWFVLVNAPRHGIGAGAIDWREPGLAEWYADHLITRLAARGLDIRDRIDFQTVRSPADLEESTNSPGGAIYGTSSNGPRAAFLRPANRSRVPGLYLVGGSAHPGGGLPLVALSAQIVATLIGPA